MVQPALPRQAGAAQYAHTDRFAIPPDVYSDFMRKLHEIRRVVDPKARSDLYQKRLEEYAQLCDLTVAQFKHELAMRRQDGKFRARVDLPPQRRVARGGNARSKFAQRYEDFVRRYKYAPEDATIMFFARVTAEALHYARAQMEDRGWRFTALEHGFSAEQVESAAERALREKRAELDRTVQEYQERMDQLTREAQDRTQRLVEELRRQSQVVESQHKGRA